MEMTFDEGTRDGLRLARVITLWIVTTLEYRKCASGLVGGLSGIWHSGLAGLQVYRLAQGQWAISAWAFSFSELGLHTMLTTPGRWLGANTETLGRKPPS